MRPPGTLPCFHLIGFDFGLTKWGCLQQRTQDDANNVYLNTTAERQDGTPLSAHSQRNVFVYSPETQPPVAAAGHSAQK